MSRITQQGAVAPLEIFKQLTSTSTGTGNFDGGAATYVGQKFTTSDGRELTLVANGATALTSGVLVQSSAIVANHQNLAVAVTSVPATAGTTSVSVTLGATVLNVGQYQGGFAIVNAGTGIGQTLRISNNPAAAASAAGVIITLEDPIQVTLDATSKICLIANPYTGTIINPTTATGTPTGVTLYPIAASTLPTYNGTTGALTSAGVIQYGLVVSKGLTSVLSDATVAAVGLGIAPSTTTAGAITVAAATLARIGRAFQTGVSAEARGVYIDL
jgi:hypothetical protein